MHKVSEFSVKDSYMKSVQESLAAHQNQYKIPVINNKKLWLSCNSVKF